MTPLSLGVLVAGFGADNESASDPEVLSFRAVFGAGDFLCGTSTEIFLQPNTRTEVMICSDKNLVLEIYVNRHQIIDFKTSIQKNIAELANNIPIFWKHVVIWFELGEESLLL